MVRYKIYPTLLDAYSWLKAAETEDEHRERERELLDKLSRRHVEPSYFASRGTALNRCVDAVLLGQTVDTTVAGMAEATESGVYRDGSPEEPALTTYVDGFAFRFAEQLVTALAENIGDAVVQPLLSATIDTTFGEVELYGYADYINGDRIVDLKTTADYTPGKYRDNWQHRVYPLLAVTSGMMERVHEFDYIVAELKSDRQPLDGRIFVESYHGTLAASEYEVQMMLETDFLPWLENHRGEITNDRVFGGQ